MAIGRSTTSENRLFVQAAFFCMDVSKNDVGAVTFTGVSNQKLITAHTTAPVPDLPPVQDKVVLVLGFCSVACRGVESVDSEDGARRR